jgi:hypothetical protein
MTEAVRGRARGGADALAAVALLALVLLAQIRASPRFEQMGSDSGMFAYAGERILAGDLLYRDVFDTKPPGVFYVDALALLIGGHSPWAIWWIGLAWITAATFVLFLTLRSLGGPLTAVAATAVFVLTLHYPTFYQGGNLTETYALLPQVLILATAGAYFARRREGLLVLGGGLMGLAILFKPTYSALGLALAAVSVGEPLVQRQWRVGVRRLAGFSLGAALPLGAVALYWAGRGAFGDLWGAVVRFNLAYSSGGFSIRGFYAEFRTLLVEAPLAALTPLALAGATVFLGRAWEAARDRRRAASGKVSLVPWSSDAGMGIVAVAVVGLPIEWLMVAVSGRNFGHYFLTPLPAMIVALAYLLGEGARVRRGRPGSLPWVAAVALTASLGLAWSVETAVRVLPRPQEIAAFLAEPFGGAYAADPLVGRIVELSSPSDSVFVWADHPDLNFISGRRAPSRYVFSLHLLLPGTGNAHRFAELLEDLANDPPALILTQWQSSIGVPFLGAPRQELCAGCTEEVRAGVVALADYLEAGYVEIERFGEWVIYGRIER